MNGTITIQTRGGAMRPLFVVLLAALLAVTMVVGCGGPEKAAEHGEEKEGGEHHEGEPGGPIELSPEAVAAAGIQYAQVTQRTAVTPLKTTGTIEANQQRMQEVTPMVGGRIERVYAAAGDRIRGGTVLAVISSPEIAELHGKEIEARARMNLAPPFAGSGSSVSSEPPPARTSPLRKRKQRRRRRKSTTSAAASRHSAPTSV